MKDLEASEAKLGALDTDFALSYGIVWCESYSITPSNAGATACSFKSIFR